MIPDFLLKVNQAKIAARTGKSGHGFQSAAPRQSILNFGTVQGRSTIGSTNVSSIVSNTCKEVKIVENRETREKEQTASPAIRSTKNSEALCTVLSRKQSCEEIQIPPPLKPKPRVKKVMKGGSLVTIPPPKPRSKARQEFVEDGGKSTFSDIDACCMSSLEGRDNACDVSEKSIEETVENPIIKETCDDQESSMNNLVNSVCESDNLVMGVSSRENRGPRPEILTEDCEQKQVPLTLCDTAVSEPYQNTSYGNSNDNKCSSAASKADENIVLLKVHHEVILDKGPVKVSNKELQGEFSLGPKCNSEKGPVKVSNKELQGEFSSGPKCNSEKGSEKVSNKELQGEFSSGPKCNSEKGSEKVFNKELQGEFSSGPKGNSHGKALVVKESEVNSEDPKLDRAFCEDHDKTPPVLDPEEMMIVKDPFEETKTRLVSQGKIAVGPQLHLITADNPSTTEKSADLPYKLVTPSSIMKQTPANNKEGHSAGEPSEFKNTSGSNPSEKLDNDKGDKHVNATVDKEDETFCSNNEQNALANNTEEITVNDMKGCDHTTVHDNDNKKNDSASSSSSDDDDEDDCNDSDDVDEDSNNDNDGNDVMVKDDSVGEYAELIMDDSTSEEGDEEDDVYPINESDSDEEEGEAKSDYEVEDMNLDSDTESAAGGITSYQDTTIGARVEYSSRKLQRERRKAKNQRKKASKKRTKAAKQAAKGQVQNRSHNPTVRKMDSKGKQNLTPTSQKISATQQPKSQGPGTGDKITEAALKSKPGQQKLPPNNATKESTMEDGSLLSMVSSFAVDLTVAANEKLFLKKRRGGQHSKKMKKAKRKAEALERIRRGDPPPRTARRVFAELPKPICTFYREGKCRKGSDCPFRHDRSTLIKKKEICRFYMHAADNCFAGEDCIFMHSSFPCKFFHTSRCREGDLCRFSHDALTEETDRLLQAFLNPPTEDPVQSPQENNLATSNQQSAGGNSRGDDPSQTLTSSPPYNLRASARKRTLSSDGADPEGGSTIGGKIAKQSESPGNDQDNKEGQPWAFIPGLYRDLSA